jgi:hypothetical protein
MNKGEHDYYAEGFEAAHTGKMAADCPHAYDTPEGEAWMAGYEDGGGHD